MKIQSKLLAMICLIFYLVSFPQVFATVPPQPAQTESQESTAISSLIANANLQINQTIQAIQNDNSSEALRLLSELRADISNINGNVTNLIFSAAAQPP